MIARIYRFFLKPILFLFHPETMHHWFGIIGKQLGSYTITKKLTHLLFHYHHEGLEQTYWGVRFPNPLGLAAGFDKDILLPNIISDVGFGWEECGSITYQAYEGNPGTKLYRLTKSQGLVVNYGLKNKGIAYAHQQLKSITPQVPLFVSIAKTNCTETCDITVGINDYIASLTALQHHHIISGFVLNISCPNSFGGEDYTSPNRLTQLLQAVQNTNLTQPVLVKLPIDKSREDLKPLIQICIDHQIHGVIISNLIKDRSNIIEHEEITQISGGISGKPTQNISDYLIGQTYQTFGDRITIIGVGGIFSAEDAYYKIKQGASLIQLITGMIYCGPQLIGDINRGLVTLMKQDGYTHIHEAIGAHWKQSKKL